MDDTQFAPPVTPPEPKPLSVPSHQPPPIEQLHAKAEETKQAEMEQKWRNQIEHDRTNTATPDSIQTPKAAQEQTTANQAPQNMNSVDVGESELFPGQYKPVAEEDVYEWMAPSRPFKRRNRQFYTTVAAITFLISAILFFAGQLLPIAVVISIAFLAYVLSSVPPENIKNVITNYGIRNEDVLYYWDELGRFWFEQKFGQEVLYIEIGRFPGRLTLLVGEGSEADISDLLSEVLLQQKPQPTAFDKAAQWLQDKVPLE